MFAQRHRQSELMDDPGLADAEHLAALRGLRRIHQISGTVGRFWRPIHRLIATRRLKQLTVMDVGCADGWILRQLWQRARREGCELRIEGCDFSQRALERCRRACDREAIPVKLHQLDVTRQSLPGPVEVIINSLFLHHFSDDQVRRLLKQFADSASRLWIVEDLVRSPLGYCLCVAGVQALTRCRVVHIDGPLSVKAAYSMSEMEELLLQAELGNVSLVKRWPERMLLSQWATEPVGLENQ